MGLWQRNTPLSLRVLARAGRSRQSDAHRKGHSERRLNELRDAGSGLRGLRRQYGTARIGGASRESDLEGVQGHVAEEAEATFGERPPRRPRRGEYCVGQLILTTTQCCCSDGSIRDTVS